MPRSNRRCWTHIVSFHAPGMEYKRIWCVMNSCCSWTRHQKNLHLMTIRIIMYPLSILVHSLLLYACLICFTAVQRHQSNSSP